MLRHIDIQEVENGFIASCFREGRSLNTAPDETHVFESPESLADFMLKWGRPVSQIVKETKTEKQAPEVNKKKVKNIIDWSVKTQEGNIPALSFTVDVSLFDGGCAVIDIPCDVAQEALGFNLLDISDCTMLSFKTTSWLIENIEGLCRDYGLKLNQDNK